MSVLLHRCVGSSGPGLAQWHGGAVPGQDLSDLHLNAQGVDVGRSIALHGLPGACLPPRWWTWHCSGQERGG